MRSTILLLLTAVSVFGQTTTLKGYLRLSSQQAAAISQLNSDYNTYLSAQNAQLDSLNRQLSNLYSNPVLDSFSIGVRYVAIENVNRDMAAHVSTLQKQVAAQLTPAQASLLSALSNSIVLQPLAQDAQCAFLAVTGEGTFETVGYAGFGTIPIFDGIVYASGPYIPPAPTGTFCGSSQFPIDVREYFSIADAQVSAFLAASASYNDYYARQQNRMADLQVQIRDETAKPSPDPTVLGMYYVQLSQVGQDIQKQAATLSKNASAVLTADQTAKLSTLQNAVALQSTASQAIQCNLVSIPPGISSSWIASYSGGPGCQL
jgi:hypothetical protein